jgi:multidrug resistance protein EbrA
MEENLKSGGSLLNPYILLAIAIVSEVFGSSMLKVSNGFKKWIPSIGVVFGMGIAFYTLSLSLKIIPLGTAYAIWSGVGTALTALVGVIVYKENFNLKKCMGLVLIIGGVILLKFTSGGTH